MIRHGTTCQKVRHLAGAGGYLHGADDDGPFTVDGITYCGRCHVVLSRDDDDRRPRRRKPKPRAPVAA